MKIWEILKEENLGKEVIVVNQDEIIRKYEKKYKVGKNGNGKIGIFTSTEKGLYYAEDIQSTDILYLDFKLVDLYNKNE